MVCGRTVSRAQREGLAHALTGRDTALPAEHAEMLAELWWGVELWVWAAGCHLVLGDWTTDEVFVLKQSIIYFFLGSNSESATLQVTPFTFGECH